MIADDNCTVATGAATTIGVVDYGPDVTDVMPDAFKDVSLTTTTTPTSVSTYLECSLFGKGHFQSGQLVLCC